ncbi:MAG: hypothetical protein JNM59_05245 [Hyphomonadaceae bacterium]|nr:hypothetical protein [Hyphomonadaceae bacterium]
MACVIFSLVTFLDRRRIVEIELRNVSFIDNHQNFQTPDDKLSWVIADLRIGGFNWPIDVVRAAKTLSEFISDWGGRTARGVYAVHLGDGAFLSVEQERAVLSNGLGEEYEIATGGKFELLVACCRLLVCLRDALNKLEPTLIPIVDEL